MKSDEMIANGVDVYMQAPDVLTVNAEFSAGALFPVAGKLFSYLFEHLCSHKVLQSLASLICPSNMNYS
jgi:hypothetical protein